ncbi:MAG: hypothetical protein KGI71_04810 [Patescibacteria group bacterium]|nr:hypothetical protein [Patescibacteria group bacterium]
MIKIARMFNPERGERVECATVAEALGCFDAEPKFIIARCETDEEFLGLSAGVIERANTTAQFATGASFWIWRPTMQLADGDGWRLCFEQVQVQRQQPQPGGNGMRHPGDGQRGVRGR